MMNLLAIFTSWAHHNGKSSSRIAHGEKKKSPRPPFALEGRHPLDSGPLKKSLQLGQSLEHGVYGDFL
jgi:hypothetical protein